MAEPNAILTKTTPEGITTISINRPHRRNAVNPSTAIALRNAFLRFEEDSTQKICIFTGTGGTFCAGYDLQDMASSSSPSHSSSGASTNAPPSKSNPDPVGPVIGRSQGPMGPSRMVISKPVIAAIAGYAVAGGLELSLLADLRVVEDDAVFGVFCRRFGVPLIDGGTVRLQRIVGLGRAMDMILTGRAVGAKEALEWGLASRVVPKGKALAEAENLANELLKFPQSCMNVDRKSAYFSAFEATSLEDALAFEFDNGMKVVQSESLDGAKRFKNGVGRHGKL